MKTLELDSLCSLDHNNFETSTFSDCIEENLSGIVSFCGDETNDENRNSSLKTHPWLSDFRSSCISSILKCNVKSLVELAKFYVKNITEAVRECYKRPLRAAKLKIEISNALMFFHYNFEEVKPHLEHFSYLEKMSDLMAMYMDMEIMASSNGIESIRKIASKITSSLKIYFGDYPEYILDSILKTNIIVKRYWNLCDLIFGWALRDFSETIDTITYIRYILAFKMWKEVMHGSKIKQQKIVKLACLKLQVPLRFKEQIKSKRLLRQLFPYKFPNSDITLFLMKAKFSVRDKIKKFYEVLAKLLASLNYTRYSDDDLVNSLLSEKDTFRVDRLLNDILLSMSSYNRDSINSSKSMSSQLLRNFKCKRKIEEIGSDIETETEIKRKKIPVDGEQEPEIDEGLAFSSLCQYDRSSIEELSFSVEEDKRENCLKNSLIHEEKEIMESEKIADNTHKAYVISEDKNDILESSDCGLKGDIEDDINSSGDYRYSNMTRYDSMEIIVESEKGEDSEHSSNLPLKKRKGISFNKYAFSDNPDSSEGRNRIYSRCHSNLSSSTVSNYCDICNAIHLPDKECLSECLNSDEYYSSPPHSSIVGSPEFEQRRIVFKTPAQLKAFNESPGLINLALASNSDYFGQDRASNSVYSEADTSSISPPATKARRRGRRKKGRAPQKREAASKKRNSSAVEESKKLDIELDSLTTTAVFFT